MESSRVNNAIRQVVFIVKNELEGIIEGVVATEQLDFALEQFLPYAFQDQIKAGNVNIPFEFEHQPGDYGFAENLWYEDNGKILKFSGRFSDNGKRTIMPLIIAGQKKGISGTFIWYPQDAFKQQVNGVEITYIGKATLQSISIVGTPVQSGAVITRLKSMDANNKKEMRKNLVMSGNLKGFEEYVSAEYNISKKQAKALVNDAISAYQQRKKANLTLNNQEIDQEQPIETIGDKPSESEGGVMPGSEALSELIDHLKTLLQK